MLDQHLTNSGYGCGPNSHSPNLARSHVYSFTYAYDCFCTTMADLEYLQQRPYGSPSLKYLLPSPLKKKFTDISVRLLFALFKEHIFYFLYL